MDLNRRGFAALSFTAFTTAAGMSISVPAKDNASKKNKGRLKLSCQEGRIPGKTLPEKLDFLEKHGFEGIEPSGRDLPKRVEEYRKALSGRKVRVSAVCAGFKGVPCSEKEEVRQEAMTTIKEILTAAGALGSTGMIVVPAFNKQTQLGHKECRELCLQILPDLGEHARKAGTRLLLEPLNRKEAYFLRQVADAAAICRDVNHEGIACMGDFWHMTWEETSDMGAFLSAGKYLRHVHIASRKNRKVPGEDAGDNYVDGFRGLKYIGYQDYVSFECGVAGDPLVVIPKAVELIRRQWKEA